MNTVTQTVIDESCPQNRLEYCPEITPAFLDALRVTDPEMPLWEGQRPLDGRKLTDVTADAPDGSGDSERWNTAKANWYLKRRRQLEEEIATVTVQAAAVVADLRAELSGLNCRHESGFREWAKVESDRRGQKQACLPLLQGMISFSTVPRKLRVIGHKGPIAFARSQGWDDLVRTEVETVEVLDSKGYARKAADLLNKTKQVAPGIEVIPAHRSLSITYPDLPPRR